MDGWMDEWMHGQKNAMVGMWTGNGRMVHRWMINGWWMNDGWWTDDGWIENGQWMDGGWMEGWRWLDG